MKKSEIIKRTSDFSKRTLEKDSSGHDWWHVYRVWQMAKKIGKIEGADLFVVELGALLHDIADYKFHNGDFEIGPKVAGEWLEELDVDEKTINHVKEIIKSVSFKGTLVKDRVSSIEAAVIQDADRLDAIGAIGIARTFSYGGYKGSKMYDPKIKPIRYKTFEEYKNNTPPVINHFYEKLLLLKDRMNTKMAKDIAHERHKFMEEYLVRFYKEWDGRS